MLNIIALFEDKNMYSVTWFEEKRLNSWNENFQEKFWNKIHIMINLINRKFLINICNCILIKIIKGQSYVVVFCRRKLISFLDR